MSVPYPLSPVEIANFATEKSVRQTWFASIFELYATISACSWNIYIFSLFSPYTSNRHPVNLGYEEIRPSHSSALKREAAIKTMTRREKLALIRVKRKT